MKLEDLKKEMEAYLATHDYSRSEVTRMWVDKLRQAEPTDPDAKLRKVREEIERLPKMFMETFAGLTKNYNRDDVLKIIDSHLALRESEVDK
jgi:hypothetical protein